LGNNFSCRQSVPSIDLVMYKQLTSPADLKFIKLLIILCKLQVKAYFK